MTPYKFIACASIAAQLLCAAPLVSAKTMMASQRCDRLAGREKARCMNVNARSERLQIRQANINANQRLTLRAQRTIQTNTPERNVRAIGNAGLLKLRENITNVRSKREIRESAAASRNACKSLGGTEKRLCIRKNMQQKTSRGM